jgi:hypothetical protein
MATLMTVTINTAAGDCRGESRASERVQINEVLDRVIQEVGTGTLTSNGSLKDRAGVVVGSWTYSPQAAS